MPNYTHTTLGDALDVMGARLGDAALRHWTQPQVTAAIREALRVWNITTVHARARGIIAAAPGVEFYALDEVLVDIGGALLRPRTVTDAELVTEIGYQLSETTATDQFTPAQIIAALERARNQFIADTGYTLTSVTVAVDAAATGGYVTLPEEEIALRRVAWRGNDGRCTPLQVSDEQSSLALNRRYASRGRPRAYVTAETAPLRLRLIPPPSQSGTLELIAVATGTPLDLTGAVATPPGTPE
jgi:hypothetical protein